MSECGSDNDDYFNLIEAEEEANDAYMEIGELPPRQDQEQADEENNESDDDLSDEDEEHFLGPAGGNDTEGGPGGSERQRMPYQLVMANPAELQNIPAMTRYEKARIIGARARDIESGSTLYADFSRIHHLLRLWESKQVPPELSYPDLIRYLRPTVPTQITSRTFQPSQLDYNVAMKTWNLGLSDPTAALNAIDLAELEFDQRRLPMTGIRTLPSGHSYEYNLQSLDRARREKVERYIRGTGSQSSDNR